jgi:hypothetical protein
MPVPPVCSSQSRNHDVGAATSQPSRATRDIGRAEPLRHDAFKAELAGVAEYNVPRLVYVIIEMERPAAFAEQLAEHALAVLKRGAARRAQ